MESDSNLLSLLSKWGFIAIIINNSADSYGNKSVRTCKGNVMDQCFKVKINLVLIILNIFSNVFFCIFVLLHVTLENSMIY